MGRRSDRAWRIVAAAALLLAAASVMLSVVLYVKVTGDEAAQHDQTVSADRKIVQTGRTAIRSGCTFDNQRAQAIRTIIRRGKAATRGYYLQGLLNREQYLASLKDSDRAIREIVVRDCAKAARVLGH